MTTGCALVLAVLATSQLDNRPGIAAELTEGIRSAKFKRVSVAGEFISGAEEAASAERIGPLSTLLPRLLARRLEDALPGTSVMVLDPNRTRTLFTSEEAPFRGLHAGTLQSIAAKLTEADAVVVGAVVDRRKKPDADGFDGLAIRCHVVDAKSGKVICEAEERLDVGLLEAAYMGESWELRRWTDSGLVPVGFHEADLAASPFAMGAKYEKMQYLAIRAQAHPALCKDCPFRMRVVVGDRERPIVGVGDQACVAINPGEEFAINIDHRGVRDAYLLLYFDGVNVLGKVVEHPADATMDHYWLLERGKDHGFHGWTSRAPDGKFVVERFVVVRFEESVAAKSGPPDRMGMITALILTVGREGIPKAPVDRGIIRTGSFGVGAGRAKFLELETASPATPPPGLLLAAITVRYVSADRLRQLQGNAE